MSILENRKVQVYNFENRDGETKYGFVIKFMEQDEVYTPYVTNSRDAIELFIDPIEYAEIIQDNGSRYTVTSNAIVFEDEQSANVAAEVLTEIIRKTPLRKIEGLLYDFAKSKFFGKKQWFIDSIAIRIQIDPGHVSEEELNNEFETYLAAVEKELTAITDDGNYNIVDYNIATGILTTESGMTFDVAEVDLTF